MTTQHKAPLAVHSTFVVGEFLAQNAVLVHNVVRLVSLKLRPSSGLKGSLSTRLSGQSAHVATQQLRKWVILINNSLVLKVWAIHILLFITVCYLYT